MLNGVSTANIAYNAINSAIAAALNAIAVSAGMPATIAVSGTSPNFPITLPTAGIVEAGFTVGPGTYTVA